MHSLTHTRTRTHTHAHTRTHTHAHARIGATTSALMHNPLLKTQPCHLVWLPFPPPFFWGLHASFEQAAPCVHGLVSRDRAVLYKGGEIIGRVMKRGFWSHVRGLFGVCCSSETQVPCIFSPDDLGNPCRVCLCARACVKEKHKHACVFCLSLSRLSLPHIFALPTHTIL